MPPPMKGGENGMLKRTTGYALRLVSYLAGHQGIISGRELSSGAAIPPTLLAAVAEPLRKAGIISTQRGNRGGYSLARHPKELTVGEVVCAMEGAVKLSRCLKPGCSCVMGTAESCPVRTFYRHVQQYLDHTLEARTIESLLPQE